MISTNDLCKELIKGTKYRFLDKNNISWRWVDSEWIGKRSVWTFDFRACWLEETTLENVKKWWCGKESDYNEIFKK
jgi:hypothetical protein